MRYELESTGASKGALPIEGPSESIGTSDFFNLCKTNKPSALMERD